MLLRAGSGTKFQKSRFGEGLFVRTHLFPFFCDGTRVACPALKSVGSFPVRLAPLAQGFGSNQGPLSLRSGRRSGGSGRRARARLAANWICFAKKCGAPRLLRSTRNSCLQGLAEARASPAGVRGPALFWALIRFGCDLFVTAHFRERTRPRISHQSLISFSGCLAGGPTKT